MVSTFFKTVKTDDISAPVSRVTSEVSRAHLQLSKFRCILSATHMSTIGGFRIAFDHSAGITLCIRSVQIRWPAFTSSIRFLGVGSSNDLG
jgi:hypothetical protein